MSEHSRRYSGPERADGLLVSALRKRRLLNELSDARILTLWAEAVGPDVAAETRAESCQRGMLTIVTGDSIQSHQLQSRSRDIIEKLNRLAGQELVRRLRFRVGSLQPGHDSPNDRTEPSVRVTDEELAAHPLDEREWSEIQGLTALIESPEIRDRVRHSLETHYRADKALRSRGWRACEECGALVPPEADAPRCRTCATSA